MSILLSKSIYTSRIRRCESLFASAIQIVAMMGACSYNTAFYTWGVSIRFRPSLSPLSSMLIVEVEVERRWDTNQSMDRLWTFSLSVDRLDNYKIDLIFFFICTLSLGWYWIMSCWFIQIDSKVPVLIQHAMYRKMSFWNYLSRLSLNLLNVIIANDSGKGQCNI